MGWFRIFFIAGLIQSSPVLGGQDRHAPAELGEEELWSSLHEQFLLSEELVFQFDEAVKNGKTVESLIREGAAGDLLYARIQAVRELEEKLESELESRMLLFFSVEDSSSGGMGMEAWIRKRSEVFRQKLRIRKEAFSFSLSRVLQFAKTFDQDRGFGLESLSSPVVLEEFRKWRARFRRTGGKAGRLSQIRKQVETIALEIQESWEQGLLPEPAQLNSDLRIFPSIGQTGNITGSGFPNRSWSLTFDDGPGALTPAVLSNLKTHGLRASFFVLTSQLEKSSEFASFARQAVQDGHDVFSHSYQHLKIPKLPESDQRHEIEEALVVFESILGFRPDLFRLPYGAGVNNSVVRGNLLKSCQVHVFWNVDTLDWQDRDPASIVNRAISQMKILDRGVILFHDIHRQSVIASERLMSYLNSEGLTTIPLSEYVTGQNGGLKWGCKPGWEAVQE
jgi:peptidoglycan/xylan/chitin deacetylase (PgdA/CDA1 family)